MKNGIAILSDWAPQGEMKFSANKHEVIHIKIIVAAAYSKLSLVNRSLQFRSETLAL